MPHETREGSHTWRDLLSDENNVHHHKSDTGTEESDDAASSEAVPVDKPTTTKPKQAKSAKHEILGLREEVRDMSELLSRLKRKRDDKYTKLGKWEKLAYDQSAEKMASLRENAKLRSALAECQELSTKLVKVMQEPIPRTREVGSIEDNEWKIGVLGFHPRRRHYNTDRIMERMHARLSSWTINSQLEDPLRELHFSRFNNKELRGVPVHLEVSMCRRFYGHYEAIADAVWKDFISGNFKSSSGSSVAIKMAEILGGGIRHHVSNVYVPKEGRMVGQTSHQLCQRISEDSRALIFWKNVVENGDEKDNRLVDCADGWISFEPAFDTELDRECCILKFSSIAQISPIHERIDDVVMLLRVLNRPIDQDEPWDEGHSFNLIKRARSSFADYIMEFLWQHSVHVDRVASRIARHTSHTSLENIHHEN